MKFLRERFRKCLSGGKIPVWLKVIFTLYAAVFVGVLAPAGPLNLLWFCNAAVLVILLALWLESSLLLSMQLLAILWPHLFWQLDYFTQMTLGIKIFKFCGLTPAEYMFDPGFASLRRCLSMQHAWMLYFLLWMVWRLGYDRRALGAQTLYAWVILLLSYALVRDIHGPAGNVNSIYGLSASEPQTRMAPWLWLVVLMVFMPLCWYGPLHFVFRRKFCPPKDRCSTV